jgi:proteic killer suppression protein
VIARLRVEYGDEELRRLACIRGSESRRCGPDVVRAFRKRIQSLRAATSEADLFALQSLGIERLDGDRDGVFSIRVNHHAWLTVTFRDGDDGGRVVTLHELVTIAEGSRHVH